MIMETQDYIRSRATVSCVSLKIGASIFGESRIRILRIVRRGERHDPRDLTVACRLEGGSSAAFEHGQPGTVPPGETLKNLVHATARAWDGAEIEVFGLALCQRVLNTNRAITRVRVEIEELPWDRVQIGGRPQGRVFLAGTGETRTAAITSNGTQVAVVGGLQNLMLMRSSGFTPAGGPQPDNGTSDAQSLLVGALTARWTYNTPDVTFGVFRQGVRAAILEAAARHAARSVHHLLYAIGDVVLGSYEEISAVTLTLRERPYRPADLFNVGIENPDEVFIAVDEPVGVVEVTMERER